MARWPTCRRAAWRVSGRGACSCGWDRRGGASPIGQSPRAYVNPRLSPDGTRIAVHLQDQGRDLWDLDLRRNTFTRVTFDPTADNLPLWTPDGSRVIFSSARNGQQNIFWQGADRAGIVEPLIESANPQAATDVSPDGRWLVFTETSPRTGEDVMRMALPQTSSGREPGEPGSVTPLVHSPSAEVKGHGPGQEVLVLGKQNVGIRAVEPVGQYAVKLVFDDGHDSGLFSWKYLHELGSQYARKWAEYQARVQSAQ